MTENLQVFKSIAEVMTELSEIGISKDRRNEQQKYKFRGIDDIYNTLSGLLSKHKICIIPYCQNRQSVERVTKSGGVSFYTTVTVKYDIISAIDGSKVECCTVGEAMDTADKSTNKAMSAAYKYLCLQVFCIPTEGDNDADATTPEPVAPMTNMITDEQFARLQELNVDMINLARAAGVGSVTQLTFEQAAKAIAKKEAQANA